MLSLDISQLSYHTYVLIRSRLKMSNLRAIVPAPAKQNTPASARFVKIAPVPLTVPVLAENTSLPVSSKFVEIAPAPPGYIRPEVTITPRKRKSSTAGGSSAAKKIQARIYCGRPRRRLRRPITISNPKPVALTQIFTKFKAFTIRRKFLNHSGKRRRIT
jgi:hypothetical protein